MTTIKNATIFAAIEKWAPKRLAYDWDNVGLQVGSYKNKVKKVMVTLDVTESVVDEAKNKNIDLIIAHHPLLFKPLKQLDLSQPKGRIIKKIIKHDISVYAAHTNLDIATNGVNDMLCEAIGIQAQKNLLNTEYEQLMKFITFVPESHVEQVRHALKASGAGHIGKYSHSTYQSSGQGTFKPLTGTTPYIGTENKLTFVNEMKIETIITENQVAKVTQAVLKVHPYEEPAYDILPLRNQGTVYGLGKIGYLNDDMTVKTLAEKIKNTLLLSHVRVTGNLDTPVRKIAVLGGSGEKYVQKAYEMGVDVFITGDMSFHTAQDAMELGLPVIDAGHYIEKVMKESVQSYLESYFKNDELECIVSETNTDPFQFI